MSWFSFLRNYDGKVVVNGKNLVDIDDSVFDSEEIDIEITPKSMIEATRYKIVVKGWMSNSSANLDFHQRWNEGVAMPCREMVGTILLTTPGMYKMDLKDLNGENRWVGFVSKSAILSMEEI